MTMDRVTFGGPPPPPPASSPPRPSSSDQKLFLKAEDEEDAEVMQVVSNGPSVCLRTKKPKVVGENGVVEEGNNVERPMSWEGELSDEEASKSPRLPHISSCVVMPTISLPTRPLGSPMCMDEESPVSSITRIKNESADSSEVSESIITVRNNCVPVSTCHPGSTTISLIKPTSPSQSNDRPPHTNLYDPSHPSSGRSYSGHYSQSPSPILTRATSSSSSRSSYSPCHSPLLGRYVSSAPYTQSPVLSRHSSDGSPTGSPLQSRHISVDGTIFSPSQSPSQGRRNDNFPSPQSPIHLSSRHRPYNSPGLVQKSEAGYSLDNSSHPPYQYDSHSIEARLNQVSPLSQHPTPEPRSTTASSASLASSASDESNASDFSSPTRRPSSDNSEDSRLQLLTDPLSLSGPAGISRQQLLSGPCPICGDRISGFHYGIFSCESCKGFFKRTVQNKKNYVCLRGANCHVTISTRKKCPACRFNKCLKMGMKLEAIREDRTRGGRSTYQCSYSLPSSSLGEECVPFSGEISLSPAEGLSKASISPKSSKESPGANSPEAPSPMVPLLIQDILSVEHLWHYTGRESAKASPKIPEGDEFLNNLCNIADNRLYKIVKWCKSLPLFRDIGMDDQIALLINSWCELLLLSCCYHSMSSPNEIRISHEKSVSVSQAQEMGLSPVIERMLNLTEHLRRLQVDQYEFVSLKVIILLTSDANGLKEPDKVRACQREVLQALQHYTSTHYPQHPSKFGELLLRLPELERACQVGKDALTVKQRAGDVPGFNLLMELLRGDH